MSLRSGEAGRALRVLGVIALICLLAMPPVMAVACIVLSAVALGVLAVRRAGQRAADRRARVVTELERRDLTLRSMTEHPSGEITFEADDGAGQRVRGALRGEDFSIDERTWIN